jgi:hypothetical protein
VKYDREAADKFYNIGECSMDFCITIDRKYIKIMHVAKIL